MFTNPFSFDGRIRRMEYGVSMIIYIFLYVIQMAIIGSGAGGSVIGLVLIIPMVWFLWAQGAKRCHDINKSGWWQLIPFYFFVLLFQDGEPEQNEYGVNAKGIAGTGTQEFQMESETLDGHLRK
jgi:uncharacterized membrane protein YhaH (DUF805 family)